MPYVWEYSRLNVTNTVMSKRKVGKILTLPVNNFEHVLGRIIVVVSFFFSFAAVELHCYKQLC